MCQLAKAQKQDTSRVEWQRNRHPVAAFWICCHIENECVLLRVILIPRNKLMHKFSNRIASSSEYALPSISALLEKFPPGSIDRLRKINEAATSSAHVLMALGYGTIDPNIGKLNQLIVKLLVRRLRAERAGDKVLIDRLEAKLKELHHAIDNITGVTMNGTGAICASVTKKMRPTA
jgi:hypothetical protein